MISLVHPSRGHITQFYGARQVDGNPHAGQDYAYSNGQEIFPEVYAAADGVVLFAGDSRGLTWPNIMYLNIDFDRTDRQDSSAGNYTILAHHDAAGNRIALTGYGHQEEVWVKAGDTVQAGQRIGTVGETGFSAGKHLHFDLVLAPFRVDLAPYYGRVNPNGYFTAGTTYNLAGSQLGTTTTPQEDDEMSAAEVAVIRGDLNTVHEAVQAAESRTRADIGTVHNTIIRDVGGQLAGLREALGQVAKGSGITIDLDAIEAAAKRGAEQALAEGVVKVDLDVTVAGQK